MNCLQPRCKIGRGVGTSASVVGGSLTIAGGILTLTTAGAAAPLLIAGIATSSVGAATNIGTSIIEKAINSKQVNNAQHKYFFYGVTFKKDSENGFNKDSYIILGKGHE